jgi:hypothetical protein
MSKIEVKLLRELQDSILFQSEFPKRIGCTHDEQRMLSKTAKGDVRAPHKLAMELGRHHLVHLQALIKQLGDAQYTLAVPTLARIWRECALVPVRYAAGHALFAIGTNEARAALESMMEDSDFLSLSLAVRAVFDRDPSIAYDYFEPRFLNLQQGSPAVARQVLAMFAPRSASYKDGKRIPQWTEPRAPMWFSRDPRWLELCARLRLDPILGRVSRSVLRHVDTDDLKAALKRARQLETPQQLQWQIDRNGDLASRYRHGQFEEVWREIRMHSHISGEFFEEVMEVAKETMQRVARNADLIAEKLKSRGWEALIGRLRTSPTADVTNTIKRFESITGSPVPPTLQGFWLVVGGIDWVWNYESKNPIPDVGVELPMDEMDPLCIHAAKDIEYLFAEWEEQRIELDSDLIDPYRLDLAPDYLHKANISGGAPYGIELPYFGADPLFANERHKLPLLDYLRLSFRWAGFPGLDEHADRQDVRNFVAQFGRGLEPF